MHLLAVEDGMNSYGITISWAPHCQTKTCICIFSEVIGIQLDLCVTN